MLAGWGAWAWIVGGLVLLAIELVAPGGVFVWLGVSAVLTGLISLVVPLEWTWLWLIYGGLALATVGGWLVFSRSRKTQSDRPFLNERAARFTGREVVLTEAIVEGFGQVKLADTTWRVNGADAPAGTRVRIVGAEGAVLSVEIVGETD